MAKIPALMDALAEQIRDAYEGSGVDIQVHGRMVTNPTDPCIDVFPGEQSRDPDTAGFHEVDSGGYLFTVRARVRAEDTDASQELLLAFMDDEDDLSLAAAIDADPTLGGAAADTYLRDPTGFLLDNAGADWIAVRWTALVINALT